MRISSRFSTAVLQVFTVMLLLPVGVAIAQSDAATAGVTQPSKTTPPAASAPPNPLITHSKSLFGGTKKILLRSAESMPEENYGFRPVASVRTYGQIIGHVADSQYAFCSTVRGLKNPGLQIEKTKISKADLIAALNDAFAFCDSAYDSMNEASAIEMVKIMGGDKPKLSVLTISNVHTIEHYGNLVTYMRMKEIVPPTSDPAFFQQLVKD